MAAILILCAWRPFLSADILEQILVKVNGEIVTKTDLEARQIAILRQRREPLDEAALKTALAELTPQVLIEAIDELLIVQRGKELGYRLSDDQLNRVLENIKKENKLETDEQFQAALKQEGMTMADLRKSLERRMIVERIQGDVVGKIGITDEEARQYYATHLAEFTTPAAVTLREILVSVPTDGTSLNVGQDEEAKAKAEALRARIVAGESFEQIAAQVSDAPSKANGGLVGPIHRDELAPALQEALASIKVGDVSAVIRTQRGYQILKLESATDAAARPFDEARDEIADRVFTDKRRAEFQKYLAKLRDQAIIEWKNDELKKVYEQRLRAVAPAP